MRNEPAAGVGRKGSAVPLVAPAQYNAFDFKRGGELGLPYLSLLSEVSVALPDSAERSHVLTNTLCCCCII